MTPDQALIYSMENKVIIYALLVALFVALALLAWLGLLYVLLRMKMANTRRRDAELAKRYLDAKLEIKILKADAASAGLLKEQALEAMNEADRHKKIRERTEARLTLQNGEIDDMRKLLQSKSDELDWLKKIVEHLDL